MVISARGIIETLSFNYAN